ncbi:MAG TPA: hypothetical protein VLV83_25130, partial [Acidobacteriota bacterium]|nr:hypothetical protein [Acidobacteriota bacterium]
DPDAVPYSAHAARLAQALGPVYGTDCFTVRGDQLFPAAYPEGEIGGFTLPGDLSGSALAELNALPLDAAGREYLEQRLSAAA